MNLHRVWALHGVRHGSLFPSQGLADQFQCWKEHMDIAASAQRFFSYPRPPKFEEIHGIRGSDSDGPFFCGKRCQTDQNLKCSWNSNHFIQNPWLEDVASYNSSAWNAVWFSNWPVQTINHYLLNSCKTPQSYKHLFRTHLVTSFWCKTTHASRHQELRNLGNGVLQIVLLSYPYRIQSVP